MHCYFRIFSCMSIALILFACGAKVELLHDISEVEANEVMAALLEAGLSAEKYPGKDGLVSLSIEQSQFSRAISLLNAEGLPHEKYVKMGDVFRKEGMISSPLEERARYLWALSQELSATVSQIDGVIKARVHVVLPERGNGADPSLPSSAAVFIKHKPGFTYDDVIPQVKRLISNSIPGLSQEKVTVVMLPSVVQSDLTHQAPHTDTVKSQKSSVTAINPADKSLSDNFIWAACASLLALLSAVAFLVWKKWSKSLKATVSPGPAQRSNANVTPAMSAPLNQSMSTDAMTDD